MLGSKPPGGILEETWFDSLSKTTFGVIPNAARKSALSLALA